MKLFPYLKMHGNARAALNKYKEVFNGSIERFSEYKNSPLANEKNADLIIHCELHFGGNIICMADMISKEESQKATLQSADQLYELCINFDADRLHQAQKAFKDLSEGGEVLMAFEKTFWQAYYGKVKDNFGIIWALNCPCEEEKKEEKKEQSSSSKKSNKNQQAHPQVPKENAQ